MCRLTAYLGHPTLAADIVTRPARSVIRQSFDARERLGGSGGQVGQRIRALLVYTTFKGGFTARRQLKAVTSNCNNLFTYFSTISHVHEIFEPRRTELKGYVFGSV